MFSSSHENRHKHSTSGCSMLSSASSSFSGAVASLLDIASSSTIVDSELHNKQTRLRHTVHQLWPHQSTMRRQFRSLLKCFGPGNQVCHDCILRHLASMMQHTQRKYSAVSSGGAVMSIASSSGQSHIQCRLVLQLADILERQPVNQLAVLNAAVRQLASFHSLICSQLSDANHDDAASQCEKQFCRQVRLKFSHHHHHNHHPLHNLSHHHTKTSQQHENEKLANHSSSSTTTVVAFSDQQTANRQNLFVTQSLIRRKRSSSTNQQLSTTSAATNQSKQDAALTHTSTSAAATDCSFALSVTAPSAMGRKKKKSILVRSRSEEEEENRLLEHLVGILRGRQLEFPIKLSFVA